jgi:hypothetical protein
MNLATENVEWTARTTTQCPTLDVENERIFVGQNESHISIFNRNDGYIVHESRISDNSDDIVHHIGITHKYLIAKSSTNFCVFDKHTLQLIHTTIHNRELGHGLSVNEKLIAYGTDNCTYVLDHDSLQMVGSMSTKQQHALQLVDEELLSNENCEILFWDIRNFSEKRRIRLNQLSPFKVGFVYDKQSLLWIGSVSFSHTTVRYRKWILIQGSYCTLISCDIITRVSLWPPD